MPKAHALERAERVEPANVFQARRGVGRILVASIPEAEAWFRAVLPLWQLSFVRTFDQAALALRKMSFDLVVAHICFDDSRMFDLLKYLRAQERYAAVPVACVRSLSKVSARGGRAIELAASALGARLFFEVTDADDGQARARQALTSLAMDIIEEERAGRRPMR
jgi:hypothetical protein